MKKVSIVIVTYRSEKDIYDCLASLFKWADISREYLEVIVVDNNSPEVERMFCGIRERYGDEIILINNSKNPFDDKYNIQFHEHHTCYILCQH